MEKLLPVLKKLMNESEAKAINEINKAETEMESRVII
jgi:hypothetical protein